MGVIEVVYLDSTLPRRSLLTEPYSQALFHLRSAFNPHTKIYEGISAAKTASSLTDRCTHFIIGISLLIPLINSLVLFILRRLSTQIEIPKGVSEIDSGKTHSTQLAQKNEQLPTSTFLDLPIFIEELKSHWDSKSKFFRTIPYNESRAQKIFEAHNHAFPRGFDPDKEYGVMEKETLEEPATVFVHADLHGDLKSLIRSLETLRDRGLLDSNFKCITGTKLIFLGDYADRGREGFEVLQLLALLRLNNPQQVVLIRGNHESTALNDYFGNDDMNFTSFLSKEPTRKLLDGFYESMPLAHYLGQKAPGSEKTEYVLFTHGLFEFSADPESILNTDAPRVVAPISKERFLSPRHGSAVTSVGDLITRSLLLRGDPTKKQERAEAKFSVSLHRLQQLYQQDTSRDEDLTAFNWGDVKPITRNGRLGERRWALSPEDVKHCLRAFGTSPGQSPSVAVKMLFRGHQHALEQSKIGNKIFIETLPIGADTDPRYAERYGVTHDIGCLLHTAPKVKTWEKTYFIRKRGEEKVLTTPQVKIRDALPSYSR